YRIAGKSGTAQVVAIKQGEKYDRSKVQERHRDHALFVGFAPAEDPKIVISVMVENGESGSGVAAPVLRQVMDAWLLDESGRLKPEYAPNASVAQESAQ
ncbi:MAG TPA: penicillin-binding protein 2, partial [Pseudomonas sp.]|nr:penicillin-binding protein 2 [Pseudomonas sp.]